MQQIVINRLYRFQITRHSFPDEGNEEDTQTSSHPTPLMNFCRKCLIMIMEQATQYNIPLPPENNLI